MTIDNPCPAYTDAAGAWQEVRDAASGSTRVKRATTKYLPMPSGFTAQNDGGLSMYAAYLSRAQFPEITAPAARGMVGLVHRIAANITLPDKLEPMRERATPDGVSLNDLHERITSEVMLMGRYGLLADMPTEEQAKSLGDYSDVPFIAGYACEAVINWSAQGDFYVLDETSAKLMPNYDWRDEKRLRELRLVDGRYVVTLHSGERLDYSEEIVPQADRGAPLNVLPFTVVGSTDITPDVDEIPLLPVARAAFAAYRLDADYRHQLFWSGQPTLFCYTMAELPAVVGSGVIVGLPPESRAEYVQPSGATIAAHRLAIADEMERAMAAGGRLLETERKSAESGEAIKRRMISQTASIVTVALNSAKGLERALKHCALFVGADPNEVSVVPNLGFVEAGLSAQDAKSLMELWMGGAISKQTLHANLQRGEIISHDRDFATEQELIAEDAEVGNADGQ